VTEMPVVDMCRCNVCGLCVNVCYCGALTVVDKVVVIVEMEECGWCMECEAVCPSGAISCAFEIVIAG